MPAWRSFVTASASDRRLLVEAAVLLALVRVGLQILAFPTLRGFLDRVTSRRGGRVRPAAPGSATEPANRVAWAVTAAARRVPGSMTCLSEALAAAAMLRRRGYAPHLRIGVQDPGNTSKPLEAHAWVECDGHVVVGELENLAAYVVLSAPGRS